MPAFKAVIDTSVMLSVAFAQQGLAKELRDKIADGAFELVSSKEIMAELDRVIYYTPASSDSLGLQKNLKHFQGIDIVDVKTFLAKVRNERRNELER